MKTKSFTVEAPRILRVLVTPCKVCKGFDPSEGEKPELLVDFNAIWDTGATSSVITPNVVESLGLSPISAAMVNSVGGKSISDVHLVGILLPNDVGFSDIQTTVGTIGDGIDLLIGMDIISRGDFAVTNKDGKTHFSFRFPSIEHIDFDRDSKTSSVRDKVRVNRKRKARSQRR